MKLKIHSKIGKYARPLNVCFNGNRKTISDYNNTVEYEFEKADEYNLTIEQIEDEKLSIIAQVILTIINCFKVMLSLYLLDSFNFADYNNIKPYSIRKTYIIKLNSNANIDLAYKDTSFSSAKNEFSMPNVEINNFSVQDEKTSLDCSVEKIKQNKKHLTITLSIIFIICFFGMSFVFYSALLSKDIATICVCSAILLFFIAVYVVSLRKIIVSYNKIIKKLSVEQKTDCNY